MASNQAREGFIMSIMDMTAWSLIAGLSLIAVGGLLIWAYGNALEGKDYARIVLTPASTLARRKFMGVLIYSVVMLVAGLVLLAYGSFVFFAPA